jgi:RimJ/RimL family protein N-acetyltransferase
MNSIVLSSDILLLKLLDADSVSKKYVDWLNDNEVNKYLESRHLFHDMQTVKSFVELSLNSELDFLFGIYIKNKMEHIGNIRLHSIDKKNGNAEIGLLIGEKKYWGMGYATKSIFLTTQFAFNKLELNKVCAGCYEHNIGSKKSFEKCGYQVEGFLRSHVESINGREGVWRLGCLSKELTVAT